MTTDKAPRHKKPKEIPTARPRTRKVHVASPTVPGFQDTVERVGSSIETMHRRKQIDDHCYRAAERIHAAHGIVYGSSVGNVMDFDRIRGVGKPGMGPPIHHLEAAEILNTMKNRLYPRHYRTVSLIVIAGHSIEQVARLIHARPIISRAEKEETGRALREGLRELADLWWGAEGASESKIVAHHAPDATAFVAQEGVVERGRVAHATSRRVFGNK